jgi:hypothetical protein
MYASGREYWENYMERVTFGSITGHHIDQNRGRRTTKAFLVRRFQIFFSQGVGYMDGSDNAIIFCRGTYLRQTI